MNDLKLIEMIGSYNKDWLTPADLIKILPVSEKSLYITVSRLVKRGTLEKIGQGLYGVYGTIPDQEKMAGQLYYPSYLSLQTVLSKIGVIDQIPLETQLVTTRKTKIIRLVNSRLVYRQVKPELFFGWRLVNGVPTAEPEKALMDLAYFASLGKTYLNWKKINWQGLNLKRLKQYSKRFPQSVRAAIDALL